MTLIEILVAMSLLAILSVMGYKAFGSLLIARERLMQTGQQWVDVARAFRRLEGDLGNQTPAAQAADLQQGLALGGSNLLLQNEADGQTLVLEGVSTRYRSGMERIRYRAGAQGLSWSAADASGEAAASYPLLDGAARVRWRVLADDGSWQDVWPPTAGSGATRSARALEMKVLLPGKETARRVWVLP